ncbi:hypothetical protein NPX13_g9353 [Xylaria arbuscula]|uniref:Uncharacterized protein n=1 Tax=Xylaria arbuscula TaxID=114810 RepID=A0A9W8N6V0_9PEZI|nr:hypothetical protein NPX13_g9353 [Xylaria arbuscula]
MHIQEISDEVAEPLKLEQSQPQSKTSTSPPAAVSPEEAQDGSTSVPLSAGMFPELSPGRSMTGKKTVDEVVAELRKTPFFMTELEENDETEALKALAYEGTPLENASEFKEQGNECFRVKRWADAKEFYTKGVLILAAEERKRKQAAENTSSQIPSKVTPKETRKRFKKKGLPSSLYTSTAQRATSSSKTTAPAGLTGPPRYA